MFSRRSIILFIGFLSLSIFTGCMKEWLDAKPEGSTAIPATEEDFRALLNSTENFLNPTPDFGALCTDQDTVTGAFWNTIKPTLFGNAFTWTENAPFNTFSQYEWPYTAIFAANVILEGVQKLPIKVSVNNMRGEALFHRASLHYGLATMFAHPFDNKNPNDEFGIPVRTSSDASIPTTRATVKSTYDQILVDLKEAYRLLPDNSAQVTVPLKKSALGLLARVYLSMEQYDSAYRYSELYLKNNSTLLDFSKLDPDANFIDLNVEVGNLGFFRGSVVPRFNVANSWFEKFEENDLRSTVFFNVAGNMATFAGSYSRRPNDIFCGVATDEMYLISAECLARKNSVGPAMNLLNKLLKSRYAVKDGQSTYIDKTAVNSDQALRIILEERAKQLIRRNVRWSDLRRLNRDPRFAKTLTRVLDGVTYTLEPNSDRYTFPIPRDVIRLTGMKQTPGW